MRKTCQHRRGSPPLTVVAALLLMSFGCSSYAADQRLSGERLGLLDCVRIALVRSATVLSSGSQVAIARGQLQQAQSSFDTQVSASITNQRTHTPNSTADQIAAGDGASDTVISDQTSGSVKLSQLLRNGITIEPAISISRASDSTALSQATPVPNRATVGINITVPIMKNPGADVAAAGERTAEMELRAVQLDQTQVLSQTTMSVVSAYWSYLAAQKAVQAAVDAETSSQQRTNDTNKLVEAEILPAAERELVAADGAAKHSARIATEQALDDARAALSRAMGLSPQEARSLPLPDEEFPGMPILNADLKLERLQELAQKQRSDLQAVELRYGEAEITLDAARRSLKPQLDLILGVGVSGLQEGNAYTNFFGSANSNVRGPNATVGLNYQFPVQNRGAVGLLAQRQGALDQLDISRKDLHASILISIETLSASVYRLGLQLTQAKASVDLYAKSVENEEIRRKMGRSTLIDVLNVSDRLLAAKQTLTNVQLNYAVTIAQLRFACGAFFQANAQSPDGLQLDRSSLTTPP